MSSINDAIDMVVRVATSSSCSGEHELAAFLALGTGRETDIRIMADTLEEIYGVTNNTWAERLGVDEFGPWAEFRVEATIQRMRWIPPGEFLMGSPMDEPNRSRYEQQHRVIMPDAYWMADTTCAQDLWEVVMGNNPSQFMGARNPVECVSWDDCRKFCSKVNGLIPGLGIRLPTEEEWEYACRAGTTTAYNFGDEITPELANYESHVGHTVDVKSYRPNAWGLYQMHGNVWEWTADEYRKDY